MTKNHKWMLCGLLALIPFFCSCKPKLSPKEKQLVDDVATIMETPVVLPNDSTLNKEKMKILILSPDTGDCAMCHLQVNDWYIYKLDINKKGIDCDVIYLLSGKMELTQNFISKLKDYQLNVCYSYEEFMRLNPLLNNDSFDVFLISPDDRVLMVGNPADNYELWKLYKRRFTQMSP